MARAAVRQNLLRRPGDLRLHFGIVGALPGAGRRRGKNAGTAVRPCSRGEPARRRDEHPLRRKTVAGCWPSPAGTLSDTTSWQAVTALTIDRRPYLFIEIESTNHPG